MAFSTILVHKGLVQNLLKILKLVTLAVSYEANKKRFWCIFQITEFLRYMAIALSEQLCRKGKNGQHIDFGKNSEKWFKKNFFSSPPLSKFYKI